MIKIALAGASVRVGAFVRAIQKEYFRTHSIVAVMDIDPGKLRGFCKKHSLDVPQFTDFDLMCDQTAVDMVIVSTVDSTHARYIVNALDRKIGVISEKPLCISVEQCRQILDAHLRNPEVFAVTSHNSRYRPVARQLHELISSKVCGDVLRVDYSEQLDLVHGKSYFRRWNSRRSCSNGLELHKSTHHFDKLNYILDSHAVEVIADGKLSFYGASAPHEFEGENCHTCPHKEVCPDAMTDYDRELFDSELYTPDMCIYSKDIDINDNFSAVIRYANGVYCNYSLCAHSHYEGETICFECTGGRIEARQLHFRDISKEQDSSPHDDKVVAEESIRIYRFGANRWENVPVASSVLAHGGADAGIFAELFSVPPSENLPTLADGIRAVLTGCAVVESSKTGKRVHVSNIV